MQNDIPPLPYPEKTPSRTVAQMPQISGEAYQHVGRYAGAVVMACFEQMGGLQRMSSWAETNPTDFYTKLFPKLIQRSAQVDVSGTVTIDDAIARLEGSPVPDGEFVELTALPAPADFVDDGILYDL